MAVSASCPKCSATAIVPERLVGQKVRCKTCESVFVVAESAPAATFEVTPSPAPSPTPSPAPPPAPPAELPVASVSSDAVASEDLPVAKVDDVAAEELPMASVSEELPVAAVDETAAE